MTDDHRSDTKKQKLANRSIWFTSFYFYFIKYNMMSNGLFIHLPSRIVSGLEDKINVDVGCCAQHQIGAEHIAEHFIRREAAWIRRQTGSKTETPFVFR